MRTSARNGRVTRRFLPIAKALLRKVLLDYGQDLVLLQSLPRYVQMEILRIRDAWLGITIGTWTTLTVGNTCGTSTVL